MVLGNIRSRRSWTQREVAEVVQRFVSGDVGTMVGRTEQEIDAKLIEIGVKDTPPKVKATDILDEGVSSFVDWVEGIEGERRDLIARQAIRRLRGFIVVKKREPKG